MSCDIVDDPQGGEGFNYKLQATNFNLVESDLEYSDSNPSLSSPHFSPDTFNPCELPCSPKGDQIAAKRTGLSKDYDASLLFRTCLIDVPSL